MGSRPNAMVLYGFKVDEDDDDFETMANDDWYDAEQAAARSTGVEVHYAVSYSEPTYVVGFELAESGDWSLKAIDLAKLAPPVDANERIRAFCIATGITYREPATWLVSFYG